MYIWLNYVGVFPYYFRKIRGTVHSRPVVPPLHSGYISTYMTSQHEQKFEWTWYEGGIDTKFHFITGLYSPDVKGDLTVPAVSLFDPFDLLQEAESAQRQVWYAQSHPQHILEYRPTNASLKEVETFQQFMTGERAMGINPKETHKLRTVKIRDATGSIRRAVQENVRRQQGQGRHLWQSAKEAEQEWEKKNAALLDRIIPLDADFVYKAVPAPRLEANILEMRNQIERQAASMMDFPIEPFSATTKRFKAQSENDLRFLNERVKTWINLIEEETQKALLLVYGDFIQTTLNKARSLTNTERVFLAAAELKVEMQCTPITTWDELVKYVDRGIMSDEDFAMHAYRLKALPVTQIKLDKEKLDAHKRKAQEQMEKQQAKQIKQ